MVGEIDTQQEKPQHHRCGQALRVQEDPGEKHCRDRQQKKMIGCPSRRNQQKAERDLAQTQQRSVSL